MLSQAQRSAILELHAKGVSKHEIARVLKLSRLTIRKVLRSNSSEVPPLSRPEKAEPYRQQILELLTNCKGNLVRVQEELAAQGATLSYQALTAFCRRHGIGQLPTVAAGHYHFPPGTELQHDTSPHEVVLGGNRLARLDVLLIDELGYLNLKPEQSNIFFKLMEERYHRHSTIITSNLVYDEWRNFLGNQAMVDALLSRLRHYCHTVHINGPSLRDPQG